MFRVNYTATYSDDGRLMEIEVQWEDVVSKRVIRQCFSDVFEGCLILPNKTFYTHTVLTLVENAH